MKSFPAEGTANLQQRIVEVFKTAVANSSEAALILQILRSYFPSCRINFDLQDCDRVLRIEGPAEIVDPGLVVRLVERRCPIERLPD